MTNGEIFRKAADYIRKHGWRKGSGGWQWEKGGRVCLEGAVMAVCQIPSAKASNWNFRDDVEDYPGIVAMIDRLGQGTDGPWLFSDQQKTSEAVIAFLDGLAFDEDLKAAAAAVSQPQNLAESDRNCTRLTTPETGGLVSQPQLVEVGV